MAAAASDVGEAGGAEAGQEAADFSLEEIGRCPYQCKENKQGGPCRFKDLGFHSLQDWIATYNTKKLPES